MVGSKFKSALLQRVDINNYKKNNCRGILMIVGTNISFIVNGYL